MKLGIVSVSGQGDYDRELVTLKVISDCDAGSYILTDTTYTGEGEISSLLRHMYWFPDRKVWKGDFIQIYTKSGSDSSFTNKGGTTTHVLHWGLKTPVWNDDGDCAVLFAISEWQHKAAK